MPVARSGVQQLLLAAGQPQVGRVAAFAGGPAAEQPGPVAQHGDADRQSEAHAATASAIAVVVAAGHRAAQGVGDVVGRTAAPPARSAPRRRTGRRGGGRRRAAGTSSSPASRRPRPRAGRPRRARAPGDSGSVPSLCSSTIDCSATVAGQRPRRSVVEVDLLGHLRRPVRVEQAQLALLPQHAFEGAVDDGGVDRAPFHRGEQRLAVAVHGGQFDVDARGQRLPGGVAAVGRDPVQPVQERHREVVGDHGAGEAVRVAQQVREQRGVRRGREPVDVGVGVHHRPGARAQGHARTAAAGRRRSRAAPPKPAPGCGRRARRSTRRSASAWRRSRPTRGRAT